jgi:hemerythrin superfamily protein
MTQSREGMDALALLHQDHVKVASLFDQYVITDAREGKNHVVDQILRELQVHAEIEETIVYPALKEAAPGNEVGEAYEEHHLAEIVMCQLTDLQPGSEEFSVKLALLKDLVAKHIEVEERVLFELALRVLGPDRLRALGAQVAARKRELLAQAPKLTVTMLPETPTTQPQRGKQA